MTFRLTVKIGSHGKYCNKLVENVKENNFPSARASSF